MSGQALLCSVSPILTNYIPTLRELMRVPLISMGFARYSVQYQLVRSARSSAIARMLRVHSYIFVSFHEPRLQIH